MPQLELRRAAACATAALALAGPSAAAAATDGDSTITVSPRVVLAAPQTSPVDFPGVTNVRAGEPLPRNWVVVRRDVTIERGAEVAFGAFRMTCPKDRTWRSGASGGEIAASVLDRNPRSRKHRVLVLATFATSVVRRGQTASGAVYALCR
jgi:hypothetical protein